MVMLRKMAVYIEQRDARSLSQTSPVAALEPVRSNERQSCIYPFAQDPYPSQNAAPCRVVSRIIQNPEANRSDNTKENTGSTSKSLLPNHSSSATFFLLLGRLDVPSSPCAQ